MKRVSMLSCLVLLSACGHPPLQARDSKQPVLVGPVRHLPSSTPRPSSAEAQTDRAASTEGERAFSYSSVLSTVGYAAGPSTVTTQQQSGRGVFSLIVDQAASGRDDARLHVQTIDCEAFFLFPVFYANSTEQCTIRGKVVLGDE
jgi:hypothetical protein